MRCHYEVLEITRTASEDEIKKSYRKLALQWHPDKNPQNIEECTKHFAVIQQAYDVLMDAQERAWYDRHREQILKGGLDEHYEDNSLNLFPYFSSTCFTGYNDEEKGFYTVYRQVFETICSEDSEFLQDQEKLRQIPQFGNSTSSYDEVVGSFYGYWQSYCTPKSYAWLDKYDILQAENRRVLRAMEKENKKIRDAAKKERNEEVRALVAFVRKRDKRVQAYRKLIEEQRIEQMKKVETQRTMQKLQNLKVASEYKEADWHDVNNREEELKVIEMQHERDYGDNNGVLNEQKNEDDANENGSDEEEDDDDDNLYCPACEKAFKTPKAYENHERSKKHKDNVIALKSHMAEDELNLLGLNDREDLEAASFGAGNVTKKSKKAKKKEKRDAENDQEIVKNDQESIPNDQSNVLRQRRISEEVSDVGHKIAGIRERRESGCLDELLFCSTCSEKFTSRNKLFSHLKETNHAALKNVGGKNDTGAKNKTKSNKNKNKK